MLWVVFNYAPSFWAVYTIKHHRKVDPETREKYSAFVRDDLDKHHPAR